MEDFPQPTLHTRLIGASELTRARFMCVRQSLMIMQGHNREQKRLEALSLSLFLRENRRFGAGSPLKSLFDERLRNSSVIYGLE